MAGVESVGAGSCGLGAASWESLFVDTSCLTSGDSTLHLQLLIPHSSSFSPPFSSSLPLSLCVLRSLFYLSRCVRGDRGRGKGGGKHLPLSSAISSGF